MSREAVLAGIRRGLRRGALPDDLAMALRARMQAHPRHLVPARSRVPHPEQVALFVANLEAQFATVARVAAAALVPASVADYLAAQNLPSELVMAPHPALRAMPWSDRPLLRLREGRAEATDPVSLQYGFAGVAETGALMLPGTAERPVTLNLLPDTAIVILPQACVVGSDEDAWDRLRAGHRDAATGGFMPRNVMFIAGPSRSADIESVLELGAHGPRRLHVVLLEQPDGQQAEGYAVTMK